MPASQLLLTSLLGTGLGLIAGIVPALALIRLSWDAIVVFPWPQYLVLLLAVPVFGALAAWMMARGKLPIVRRQTLV